MGCKNKSEIINIPKTVDKLDMLIRIVTIYRQDCISKTHNGYAKFISGAYFMILKCLVCGHVVAKH